jgi:tetratricopeptide (TPR) repeat protein
MCHLAAASKGIRMAHHFISYPSTIREIVIRLADELAAGPPALPVWVDKRKLRPAEDWDDQLDDAIRRCDSLLFVMTPDSVRSNSVCKQEWTRALKYKKPVVPLLFDRDATMPFRLGSRQYIDFTGNWDTAVAQLRKYLQWLESDQGILHTLKQRLADAERDLERADEDGKPRIQQDIDALTAQVAEQQRIVDNPQAAAKRTQRSIERGIQRERQPEQPVSGVARSKFINPPPAIVPTYFQGRQSETARIGTFLQDEAKRLLLVVGRGGIGKTAVVCRLLKALERGCLPDDSGELPVDGIVYLSANGSRRVNVPNLYADLSKLLPDPITHELDATYTNAQLSTEAKMQALLQHFPAGRVVLLLDNFEDVIDSETLKIQDRELDEALNAMLKAAHHGVKVIITSRIPPRELLMIEYGRQSRIDLDQGLPPDQAAQMVRALDEYGTLGLRDRPADDPLLAEACARALGFPRALEALVALLSADRDTSLDEMVANTTQVLPEKVVEALVGEAFSRLDPLAQQVMQALAIYARPVTPTAIDYLLQPYVPSIDSALALNRLVNMQFARKEAGRYYLHPVDRDYALSLIPQGTPADRRNSKRSRWTQAALLDRGADYFQQTRKPRDTWKTLDDLAPQLAEFELRYAGGDYSTAASVLHEISSNYLHLWGYYRLQVELHQRLQGKFDNTWQRAANLTNLGNAYHRLGDYHRAIDYYQQNLALAQEIGNRKGEGVALGNLGNVYYRLGDYLRAIDYYQQDLSIACEIGDHQGEGVTLCNLGLTYDSLGDYLRAIDYYQQSLTIIRMIVNRKDEGSVLGNLGLTYHRLGDYHRAIDYYQQALTIAIQIGDRLGEAIALGNLGEVFAEIGNFSEAISYAHAAATIANDINSPYISSYTHGYLARTYLHEEDVDTARTVVETALRHDVAENNHKNLALLGIIVLRQGDHAAAKEAFARAIAEAESLLTHTAQNHEALDSKALALCGLALIEGPQHIPAAIETYRAARTITKAAGMVGRGLRLLDALAVVDEQGILKDVRAAAAGET